MTDINTWNAIDDSNNSAPPAGWPEGQMPSTVNNTARAMMGSIKRWRDQIMPTVTATGIGNAQIITYPVAPAALTAGDRFAFYSCATNNAPATLQVNAQPAKAIRTAGNVALAGGEMPAGAAIYVCYDGTNFRLAGDPVALKKTGDTMTGTLTVPGIVYSGTAGHVYAFGWDGVRTHVYVDTNDVGTIGDIESVTAGNGLTGGGASGAVTLSMSGSYTGNFTASGTVTAGTLTSTGTVQGALLTSTGNVNATSGTVTAGAVTAGTLTSTGGANITGGVNTGALNVHGVAGFDTNLTVGGTLGVTGQVSLGGRFAITDHVICYATINPGSNATTNCGEGGAAWAGVGSYNFVNMSDPAAKQDISPVPAGCLELVGAITPKTYRWRRGEGSELDDRTHWGFLSTDVADAMKQRKRDFGGVVTQNGVGGLVYSELVALLWGAVRELSSRLEQLEAASVK